MVSIYQYRSQTPQDAPLHHALKTSTQTVSILVLPHGPSPYLMTELWTGPDGLKGPLDSSGSPVGCKSDCEVDPNPANSPSCCSGSFSTPETCPNSGVPNYSYFSACFRFPCVDMLCNTLFQSRGALIHTCMRMMNRAGLRFGLVQCRRLRITQLPSALKFAMHRITFVCQKCSDPCSLSVYYFKYRVSETLNFIPRLH